jgi:hypothetical protein
MWVLMSAAGREEFLAGVHIAVLSAAAGTAGRTLAVPVWYSYQPGPMPEEAARVVCTTTMRAAAASSKLG